MQIKYTRTHTREREKEKSIENVQIYEYVEIIVVGKIINTNNIDLEIEIS